MDHSLLDFFPELLGGEKETLVTFSPQEAHQYTSKYINNDFMEITVTFTERVLYTYTYRILQDMLTKDLSRLTKEFIIVQDYSKTGRLHYHGLVRLIDFDKLQRLQKALKRKYGRTEIKQITYQGSYIDYIFGQYLPTHSKYIKQLKFHDDRISDNIGCKYTLRYNKKEQTPSPTLI